jgi:3-isopropylmalate dehydratase small subunit
MEFKDSRVKLINEILNGIKVGVANNHSDISMTNSFNVQVLKLYAWERSFKDQVNEIRNKEIDLLKASQYLSAASAISWFMAPYIVRRILSLHAGASPYQ